MFSMKGALDVLAVGEEEALSLGMRPRRVRWIVIGAASLAAASAVAVSGLIAFVGIIVPHAVRLVVGASNRLVVHYLFSLEPLSSSSLIYWQGPCSRPRSFLLEW